MASQIHSIKHIISTYIELMLTWRKLYVETRYAIPCLLFFLLWSMLFLSSIWKKDQEETEQEGENLKCGYITILIFGSMKISRLDSFAIT